LRAIEAGPAFTVDLDRMREGAPNRAQPETELRTSEVFVPKQTAWPIRFLGETVTTSQGPRFLEMLVFVRSSPSSRWQVNFDPGIPTVALVCAPLGRTVVFKGPAFQDAQRARWGPDLAPGTYRTITAEFLREPCLLVGDHQIPIGVLGADEWPVALRGELR